MKFYNVRNDRNLGVHLDISEVLSERGRTRIASPKSQPNLLPSHRNVLLGTSIKIGQRPN